ncbi:MAG: phosphoesterase [Lachnospiraceae bacterium]|nr:phosphoesterase [Lachnospiraceae bacterium]
MISIILYAVFYLSIFFSLENRTLESYHIIECGIDRMIPYCGIFIVPYLIWFPYQFALLGYFFMVGLDHKEFYRFMLYICGGMTCFLLVSWLYPNALELRPALPPDGTVFDRMVQGLYLIDTPTNVLPSIHVFNSVVFHITFCRGLERGTGLGWKRLSLALITLIIISTVLIKQHSVIDLVLGFVMAGIGYLLIYQRMLRRVVLARLAKQSYPVA